MNNKIIQVNTILIKPHEDKYDYISSIFYNARINNIDILDEKDYIPYDSSVIQIGKALESGFPIILLAQSKGINFQIRIECNKNGHFIRLYPIEPYKKKIGIDSEEEKFDFSFYIMRMIELTENFVIHELIAE